MESNNQNKNLENQLNLNTQQVVENFNNNQINIENKQEELVNLKNSNKKLFNNIKDFLLINPALKMKELNEISKNLKNLENAKKLYDENTLNLETLKKENNLLKNSNNILENFFSNSKFSKDIETNEDTAIENINNLTKFYEKHKLKKNILNSTKDKKTAFMQTFAAYAQELKKINDEIFIETKKMERYLEYIYEKINSMILNIKNSQNGSIASSTLLKIITSTQEILIKKDRNRLFEKLILIRNKKNLNLLQEKFKNSSLKFEFNKIKDIIEKIKEKKEYLNKLKIFTRKLISPKKEKKEYEKYLNLLNFEEDLNENFKYSTSFEKDISKNNFNPKINEYFNFLSFKEAKNFLEENFKNANNSNSYLNVFKFQIEILNKILITLENVKNIKNQYSNYFIEFKSKQIEQILENCWLWCENIINFLERNSKEKIDFLDSQNN